MAMATPSPSSDSTLSPSRRSSSPTVLTQLALVQHVGDGEGGRQFEGALNQLATLKINQDRSIGHQNRHASSSERNRSLGMIEPIIEPSDTNSQQFRRLGLR